MQFSMAVSQSLKGMVKYLGGDTMNSGRRFGVFLIVLGLFLVVDRMFPILSRISAAFFPWPFLLIGLGILLLYKKSKRN